MQRVWLLAVFIFLGALALPATAAAWDNSEPAVVIYGDVRVEKDEGVDGIYVARGDVRLDGGSADDVVVFSGDVTVSGRIEGDLVALDGLVNLLPGAYVNGDVRYGGDQRPLIARDATVTGDVVEEDWDDSLELLPFIGAVALWLGISVSMAILGVLLLLIAPRAADAISARSRERVGIVIAIGIAVAICLPLAAGIAAVTLVGIPLAFVIVLALLPAAALAYVAAAYALGRRILPAPRNQTLSFLAGLAILRALALIPFLGFLVGLAAVVFGLGLIAAAIGAARDPAEPTPARSPGN
ncbi:MAG TPA: polymer-forming cytoskeletal protein [Solirubrobacterales bacterium]|nr:polymer-forming cytoskeletal protein [Solirubrobacterales bacterium]